VLRQHGLRPEGFEVAVLIEGARTHTGSTAVLRTLGALGFPWSLAAGLLIVPRWLREPAYRAVARNRHRLFRALTCPEPDPAMRDRLLA
jgi:predicted DCC family thiol-disulfide oxidoreductase YuxK